MASRDGGVHKCKASDILGVATSSAKLTVQGDNPKGIGGGGGGGGRVGGQSNALLRAINIFAISYQPQIAYCHSTLWRYELEPNREL